MRLRLSHALAHIQTLLASHVLQAMTCNFLFLSPSSSLRSISSKTSGLSRGPLPYQACSNCSGIICRHHPASSRFLWCDLAAYDEILASCLHGRHHAAVAWALHLPAKGVAWNWAFPWSPAPRPPTP